MKFKRLFPILFAVGLSNCGSVPKRPHGEVCGLATDPVMCACVDSETGSPTSVRPIDKSPNGCGGYVSISPEYYQQLEDWIQELIKKVRGFPRQKALAIDNLTEIHNSIEAAKSIAK